MAWKIGKEVKGTLYRSAEAYKFGLYTITENDFLDEHDIKVDVQKVKGVPKALTIQVAEPGTLALSPEEFEKSGKPTAYIKCDYDNYPKHRLYDMVDKIVGFFDKYKNKENRQYFAMHGDVAREIPKEKFYYAEYYIDRKLISINRGC